MDGVNVTLTDSSHKIYQRTKIRLRLLDLSFSMFTVQTNTTKKVKRVLCISFTKNCETPIR